jgi:hypothetical protein
MQGSSVLVPRSYHCTEARAGALCGVAAVAEPPQRESTEGIEFLRLRLDAVAEQVSDDEVEVSLVGSYNADAMRMELYLRVRAWEAGRGAAAVEVELID